jgi:hypothetical protein
MELLQYTFFQHALAGSLFTCIACGIVGAYIVSRRLVFISGKQNRTRHCEGESQKQSRETLFVVLANHPRTRLQIASALEYGLDCRAAIAARNDGVNAIFFAMCLLLY